MQEILKYFIQQNVKYFMPFYGKLNQSYCVKYFM